VCVHASLSQDGFQERIQEVDITPFLTPRELFCPCTVGKVSTSRTGNMWSPSFLWAGLSLSYYPPAIIFILEYLSTGTNCSCLAGGPSISCLRVVSKVEGSGGPVTTALATSSRQGPAARCTWQELDPGRNCLSSPSGLVFPSKLRLATIQWRPQFPMAQGSIQREPPGQPYVPTGHVLRVVPFWAQGSLAH